jgi:hypothetical protein
VIIGSVVVSIVAVVALIVALTMNKGGGDDKGGGGSASASASASHQAGYRGPDRTRVIDKSKCTDPTESWNDETKVQLPDFRYKDINSVKACFQAAKWQYKIKPEPDNTWGDGTVLDQFPAAGTNIDPKNPGTIELSVSTGNPS